MSSIKAMFSFFTMIRLDIDQKDMDDMNRRFYLVPIIGVFYGLIAVGLLLLLNEVIPAFAAAVLAMFIIQGMNRFLHIDGTIDVGDGLVVAGKREDHLRALKDTRIGAGGMAFALFVIVLTLAALSGIEYAYLIIVPFMAEVLAKNSMVASAAFGKPGSGMAGDSVRNTGYRSLLVSLLISVAVILVYVVAVTEMGWFDLEYSNVAFWLSLGAVVLASVISGIIMAAVAEKNFGMVNGDVLGATNEISRAVTLLMMLALIPVI